MKEVDKFKENLLFEKYKDKQVRSCKGLFNDIKREYDYEVSSDLYKKIINYQIKKYGSSLRESGKLRRSFFGVPNQKAKRKIIEWSNRDYRLKKFIERNEEKWKK